MYIEYLLFSMHINIYLKVLSFTFYLLYIFFFVVTLATNFHYENHDFRNSNIIKQLNCLIKQLIASDEFIFILLCQPMLKVNVSFNSSFCSTHPVKQYDFNFFFVHFYLQRPVNKSEPHW